MTTDATSETTASTAGANAGASTISRDDIQNIVDQVTSNMKNVFTQTEQVADIGSPEAQARGVVTDSSLAALNGKRTYDEMQDISLARARSVQAHFDDLMADISLHRKNVINQFQQNARGSHNDQNVAVDRTWNVDEVSGLVAKTPVELDANMVALLKTLTDMVNAQKA
jgi:hypothetical protein